MERRLRIWSCVSAIWFFILAYHVLLARDPGLVAVRRDRVYDRVRCYAESALRKIARTVGCFDWDWNVFKAGGKQCAELAWHVVLRMTEVVKGYVFRS